jgi:16S rRNA (cytosine1402-N4)-methyltransferase
MSIYHEPVLAKACIEAMNIQKDGVYVDATFGGGGHSRLIINELGEHGRLFGFDQDADARANVPANEPRFTFVQSNFQVLKKMLRIEGVRAVDGILADLGVSSHQIDTAERGFSYRFDALLDMRMNQFGGQTAADFLNKKTSEELQEVFSEFGEVRNSKTLAQAILAQRDQMPFKTTGDLLRICEKHIFGERMRYFSQVFQALRMAVNEETKVLEEFLKESLEILNPNGRLVVLTYHSIEDRLVKNCFKTGNAEGKIDQDFYGNITRPWEIVNKKVIEADAAEIKRNPRARSAKLRVAAKKMVNGE